VNSVVLFDAVGLGLLVLGLHALFFRPHLVHKLVAANVAASGTFLVLVRIPAEGVPDPVSWFPWPSPGSPPPWPIG
jgi:hypothetical protein